MNPAARNIRIPPMKESVNIVLTVYYITTRINIRKVSNRISWLDQFVKSSMGASVTEAGDKSAQMIENDRGCLQ